MTQGTQPDAQSKVEKITQELIAGSVVDFLRAFMGMLGVGALHGEIAAVPHPGYWSTFLIIWGLGAAASAVRKP